MKMKKIFSMLLTASCLFGLASCSDDDGNSATPLSTIKVVSAQTSLQARPDTGSVVVDCEPVKAYVSDADQSWLKVEVKGDSVKFYAKQNLTTESRNAMLTIKKSANDSVMLNVDQLGMIFIVQNKVDIMQINDDANNYYFNVKTDYEGKVVSTPDWITAKFEDSRLKINVASNEEGHIRVGYVAYSCGNFKDSVKVTQYDFEKDILGDYELWIGYNPITDVMERKVDAVLAQNANGLVTLKFSALYGKVTVPLTFPVSFDSDSISLSINSGDQVASYKDKKNKWTYFFTVFASPTGSILPSVDANGDSLLLNKSGIITAQMQYDKKKGTYGSFSGLAYNEGGYSAEFKRMYIGAFSESYPYKKYLINNEWWASLYDMVLVKKEK